MAAATDLLSVFVSYALVGLTAWETCLGWVRYRDRYRADSLVVVALLAAILLVGPAAASMGSRAPAVGFVIYFLFLAQPYFLLRLVHRFHPLSRSCRWAAIGCAAVGAIVSTFNPPAQSPAWTIVIAAHFVVSLSYAAWVFGREATRATGVSSRRLWFAAAGTWIHAGIAVIFGLEVVVIALAPAGPSLRRLLGVGVFACYYVGLVGPRRLRTAWAHRELYRHMREAMERPTEERARMAASELSVAAGRGVASAATAVLFFDDERADRLSVRAASDPAWRNLAVIPGNGLVGRALRQRQPLSGAPADFESPIAGEAGRAGASVLSIPIATQEDTWGVLVVVQRQGSLFPDDDLELLQVLCQYAAVSLTHARLLAVEQERMRRAADARVHDSEARVGLILESIADYAVLLLDDRGRVATWKAGAEAIFGYAPGEIAGMNVAALFGRDPVAFQNLLSEARRRGQWAEEGECWRRDGASFPASTTIRPTRPSAGGAEGFVVVTRDETDRRGLEERVRQAEKMQAVGQLAGGIAHDFNNLLGAILGYASLIQSHPACDPIFGDDLNQIIKAVDQAAALTNRLLTFSRRQVLQPTTINLAQVVDDVLPLVTRLLKERITVTFTSESCDAWILADPVQIEQIILNLAINARDAMPQGGRLTIRVARTEVARAIRTRDGEIPPGFYTTLVVSDSGQGMDKTVMAKLFEPFFTTKDVGRGRGLGLATVYGVVQQMRGGLVVESAPAEGATFQLYFPAADPPGSGETAGPRADHARRSETILVVDDDEAIRGWVVSLLTRRGYTVIEARDASEATALVDGNPVDLVVADIVMPGGMGIQLVESLARSRPSMKALFISGYTHSTLGEARALPAGDQLLRKPFSAQEILTRVRTLLDA